MITDRQILLRLLAVSLAFCLNHETLFAQGVTKWIQVGSMHNWYSEKGWEIEEGNILVQQYGLRWPAQYQYQDMQAAKGFWIGTTNFTDERNITYPHKVVHVGPRVNGDGEFFPLQFDLYAKFERPRVLVDGDPSFAALEELTGVSDTLKADRLLVTKVNTAVGITMERKIYAFSQQYHDNYHIFDITFTNTGNTDADPEIELAGKTLTDVYFYWQFRYSVLREVRYMVNNSSGWGINTMNDARGPWYPDAPTDLRTQFSWHGYHQDANRPPSGSSPNAASFDNIGAPIWNPGLSAGFISTEDTTWRLGAAQFVGNVHLHADTSPTDRNDDPSQPSTTNYIGSDEPRTRNNSQFNTSTMTDEYQRLMSAGHEDRHAWLVMPSGNFTQQNVMANIGVGAPGGWSSCNGYGPYTLGPGESIRIVFAEGADGLTREEAIRIGRQYRDGAITTEAKNDSVFLGRDRLFETFRRAVANFASGYDIPQPPFPPSMFEAAGGGNRITLSWQPNAQESANGFLGYRLYRATGKVDSTYHLIFQAGGTAPTDPAVGYSPSVAYSFDDITATRGVDYYYYVSAFGDPAANTGAGMTPAGSLESSRFYTQTYNPTNLKRPPGTTMSEIRIVPNPFIISSSANVLRFPDQPDRIAFFNIPGNCLIKIYTELGELIKEIDHTNGTGDEYWNSITSSDQVVVSGVYIVVFENKDTGERTIKKLVIIR
ncbi:MAG: hypothetical protein HYW57_00920 [Ignavibacteriales bacterium]|nr:hypothetical protein [Ignavibacteriales bacterium]